MKRSCFLLMILLFAFNGFSQNWIPLDSGFNYQGRVLYTDTVLGKLFVGGAFTMVSGHDTYGIAAWDGSSWDTLDGGMGGLSQYCFNYVSKIKRFNNDLYVEGIFTYASGKINSGFTKWSGTSWDSINIAFHLFNDCVDGTPANMCESNNLLYIVGLFDSVGSYYSPGIVAWDGNNWIQIGIPHYASGNPAACCVFQNELYMAGNYSDSLGILQGCSKWNGTSWTQVDIGGGGLVRNMVVYNNELYICGQYIGSNYSNLAKYDGNTFTYIGGDINSVIENIEVINNKLFAVGAFDSIGGVLANDIAIWDGTNWSAFSSDSFNGTLSDITVFNNELYVTGAFQTVNNVSGYNGIAKYQGWNLGENVVKEKSGVFVYPNPASNRITITLPVLPSKEESLIITNVLGTTVYHQTLNNINTNIAVSGLSNGVYFYQLINEIETTRGKFVIER